MAINLKNYQNMTFFLVIAVLIAADIIFDFKDGISFKHLLVEFVILFISLVGLNLYFDRMRFLARQITDKESRAKEDQQKSMVEIETLKSELSTFKNQFKTELAQQFKKWKFTPAESEVAVYLLKGLSLKEIADMRQCNEKTIRAQCTAIYKKSDLKGRSQLSSYFLDFIV